MKTTLLHLIMALSALISTASLAAAENNSPPDKMTFQGFLTDATQEGGPPLGAETPVNVTLTFRIYDAVQEGTIRWAEQQIVTVDNGHFSVLLGEGIAVPPTPVTTLAEVFTKGNASERYIGITVKPEGGEEQAEIAPRLQFFPSPYAHLARRATSLVDPNGNETISGSVSGNILTGPPAQTKGAARQVVISDFESAGAGSSLSLGYYDNSGQNKGGVIQSLGEGDPLSLFLNPLGGTVNMGGDVHLEGGLQVKGLSTFEAPLTTKSSGGWLSLVAGGNGGTDYVAVGNEAGRPTIAANTSAGAATHLSINPHGGNVGIGVAAPAEKLDVNGNVKISGAANFGTTTGQKLNLHQTASGNIFGIGVQASTLYSRSDDFFAWFKGGTHDDRLFQPGPDGTTGKVLMTLGEGGLAVNRGNLYVNEGGISSPKWKITEVIGPNYRPTPNGQKAPGTWSTGDTFTFTSGGGRLAIFLSATGHTAGGAPNRIELKLNGTVVGETVIHMTTINQHYALPARTFTQWKVGRGDIRPPAGTHTIELNNSTVNGEAQGAHVSENDRFQVVVTEYPF